MNLELRNSEKSDPTLALIAHAEAQVLFLRAYSFDWNVFAKEEEKMKRKKLARLQTLAASMNYQLVPNP